jgi:hypothetical protein
MPDPVLRIPVDDGAFQKYLEAFQRYQGQLEQQPEMWENANEGVHDGIAANLALADAIGASVAAAVRLGSVQDRNSQARKRDAQEADAEEQRSSAWRRKSLDHVQELSRTAATVVRGFTSFATGGGGGLFGGISAIGKGLGGTIGGLVNLAGHTLNAGYEINSAVSDKGQFARGIGATINEQEGFHNNLGRYTNTDQGIDAVMNARGTPQDRWQFNALGVKGAESNKSNAELYGDVLKAQVRLAQKYTRNGVTNYAAVDPRGGSAFGTTHEDLNRLMKAPNLDKAIADAVTFKTALGEKQTDAATKSAVAVDNLTTKVTDAAQALVVGLDPGLDKATKGLNDLYDAAERVVGVVNNVLGSSTPDADVSKRLHANDPKHQSWMEWGAEGVHKGLMGIDQHMRSTFGMDPIDYGHGKPMSSKSDVANYRTIGAYLKKQGLSDSAAFGAAAGVIAESHGNSNAFNDKSGALGIEQLLGDRKKAYLRMARADGKAPHDLDEQLKYLAMELKGQTSERGGAGVLSARSQQDALHAYVYKFMRPQGRHNEHLRDAIADERRGTAVAQAANVSVKVSVVAPPGHQAAVSVNSAARGK